MISVKQVKAAKFIDKLKEELKKFKELQPSEWSTYVKSGSHTERPPAQPDFWFIRTASILRRLYLNGPVGVDRLRTYYGGRKRRGHKPAKFRKASGSVVRKIMQQLEAVELVKKSEGKKGRELTPKGRKLLDRIAYEVRKE